MTAPSFTTARTDPTTVEFTTPAASGAISGYEYSVSGGTWQDATGSQTITLTDQPTTGVTVRLRATGYIGDGDVTTVAVPNDPSISAQPQDVSKRSDQTAQFSVTASVSDGGSLSYQWQKSTDGGANWADVSGGSGGTAATYTTPAVSYASPKAQYRVRLVNTKSGSTATAFSSAATLTVGAAAPTITTQPQSVGKISGQTAQFSATATVPEGNLSYQWQLLEPGGEWTDIDGATNASYTTAAVGVAMTGDQYRVKVTNTLTGADPETDTTTSNPATLTVGAAAPSFALQPTGQSIRSDQAATFTAAATSVEGVVSYQWQTSTNNGANWVDVSSGTGGTTVAYTTPKMMYANPKVQYRVIATNTLAGGSPSTSTTTSNAVALTVGAAVPTITTQPTDAAEKSGQAVSFTVAATNPEGVLSYQWQHSTDGGTNWSDVPSATASTYSIDSVRPVNAGLYRANVTNTLAGADPVSASAFSDAATLTVGAPDPVIGTSPVDTSVDPGADAVFSVAATSSEGVLSYQWQVLPSGGSWTDLDGATSDSYTVAAATVGMSGTAYRVQVTNTLDGATPATATATSVAAMLTIKTPDPVIGTEPADDAVASGEQAMFSVAATTPSGTLSYQWQESTDTGSNWSDIAQETGPALTTAATTAAMNGTQYRVQVTNTLAGATPGTAMVVSAAATLTVETPAPVITTEPADAEPETGQTATFAVVAEAAEGALSYQWQVSTDDGANWTDVGADSDSYTTPMVSYADNGTQYRVQVTNTLTGATPDTATTTSAVAVLTMAAVPPVDPDNPVAETPLLGDAVTFTAGVPDPTDGGTLSYQWFLDGQPIEGATAASLTIDPVGAADQGVYTVVVTNTLGNGQTASTTVDAGSITVPSSVSPQITSQPQTPQVVSGQSATLSVAADASAGTLSYQWQVKTPGGQWTDVPSATQASMQTPVLTSADDGTQYRVVVTTTEPGKLPASQASDPVTITVDAPTPGPGPNGPTTVAAGLGGTVKFTAPVTPPAEGTMSYQWLLNGQPIAGATGPTLTVSPVGAEDAGVYSVVVTTTLSSGSPSSITVEAGTLVVATPGRLGPQTQAAGQKPGDHVVLVDGQPQQVQMTSGPTGVELSGNGFALRLAGMEPGGKRMPTDANGNLVLAPGGYLRTAGDGFAPDGPVEMFVMSTPRRLGAVTADAKGAFSGQLAFPKDLTPGDHTVQVNGYTPDGKVRSVSLGVVVQATGQAQKPNAAATPPKRIKKRGVTVIARAGAATTAGQRVTTRVRCISPRPTAAGERRNCRIQRGPDGKVSIRTLGIPNLRILVLQTARATSTHTAYRLRTVYIDGKKR